MRMRDDLPTGEIAADRVGLGRSERTREGVRSRGSAYVLVHGAWHGAWCWRRVSDRLASAGQRVIAPTLTGLGARRHLLNEDVNLDTHIRDVTGVIESEELNDVVLVGHSYGGIIITGVAEKASQCIKQLVYLDSVIVEDGESWSSAIPPESAAARIKAAQETSGGLSIPAPKAVTFGITDSADQAWVDRRMTPHPFAPFLQQVKWTAPIGNGLPKVYIDCTDPQLPTLVAAKGRLRGRSDWPFVELKTGHDAMVTAPEELADILLRFA